MRPARAVTLLAFAFFLLSVPAASADALWDRAIGISVANRDLVPGQWVEHREVFNVKRESNLRSTTIVTFAREPTGQIQIKLVHAVTNGVDITEEWRETFDEDTARFSLRDPSYNPFHPDQQRRVKASRDGRSRVTGATVLVAYTYRQQTDNGTWSGTAWIDEVSGRPVELSARLLGLPRMIDRDERHELILNIGYSEGADGAWFPVRIATYERATLDTFPYAKFYGTIETAITLSDFWKIEFK